MPGWSEKTEKIHEDFISAEQSILNTTTHREAFSKSYYIDPKSDCIYHFPIDLELNARPFGSKL